MQQLSHIQAEPFTVERWLGRIPDSRTNERWLEEGLWATETFIANGDDLPIRQFIALFQRGGRGSSSHLILKVQSHIAQLFLDVTDNLTLSCQRE